MREVVNVLTGEIVPADPGTHIYVPYLAPDGWVAGCTCGWYSAPDAPFAGEHYPTTAAAEAAWHAHLERF